MTPNDPELTAKENQPRDSKSISRRTALTWLGAAGTFGSAGFLGAQLPEILGDTEKATQQDARLMPAFAEASPVGSLPAGVAAPMPAFGHILAIDLTRAATGTPEGNRATARDLLIEWSALAGDLRRYSDPSTTAAAGSDMRSASLELTIGVGASLLKRCGLTERKPDALVVLPEFADDRLLSDQCDGDFMVQLGAEDPMRLSGAVQAVLSTLRNRASLRWSCNGFVQTAAATDNPAQTGRNLMGHRDGTNNPEIGTPLWASVVTAREATEPMRWMDGGSYAVVRQIAIDLEGWFTLSTPERDKIIGRKTITGAALGHTREEDSVELARRDPRGKLMIDPRAHIRLASPQNVAGQRIYRRSWNFDHGSQGKDGRRTGLLFVAWQADPRRGFIPVQRSLDAGNDLLGKHIHHFGSAVFAVPPLQQGDRYVGQGLFED